MILTKTERGRALLADRRALSPRERQLLVLTDGRRSTAELRRWLGFEVEPLAQRLLAEGYLARATSPAWRAEAAIEPAVKPSQPAGRARPAEPSSPRAATDTQGPNGVDRPRAAAAVASPVATAVARPAEPAPARPVGSSGSRRSLAACKMYVVSLMQMLRDADAASMAVSLHCAEGVEDLVDVFTDALVFLNRRSGPDYATRVANRLLEVMPLVHLPQLCDALAASGADALKDVAEAQRDGDTRLAMPIRRSLATVVVAATA